MYVPVYCVKRPILFLSRVSFKGSAAKLYPLKNLDFRY